MPVFAPIGACIDASTQGDLLLSLSFATEQAESLLASTHSLRLNLEEKKRERALPPQDLDDADNAIEGLMALEDLLSRTSSRCVELSERVAATPVCK